MALTTTTVRTFDGRQVLLPNSTMHPSVVVVQTGYETVRTSVRLDLDDTTDLSTAKAVALSTMADLAEVASQPEPEALLVEVGKAAASVQTGVAIFIEIEKHDAADHCLHHEPFARATMVMSKVDTPLSRDLAKPDLGTFTSWLLCGRRSWEQQDRHEREVEHEISHQFFYMIGDY